MLLTMYTGSLATTCKELKQNSLMDVIPYLLLPYKQEAMHACLQTTVFKRLYTWLKYSSFLFYILLFTFYAKLTKNYASFSNMKRSSEFLSASKIYGTNNVKCFFFFFKSAVPDLIIQNYSQTSLRAELRDNLSPSKRKRERRESRDLWKEKLVMLWAVKTHSNLEDVWHYICFDSSLHL